MRVTSVSQYIIAFNSVDGLVCATDDAIITFSTSPTLSASFSNLTLRVDEAYNGAEIAILNENRESVTLTYDKADSTYALAQLSGEGFTISTQTIRRLVNLGYL